MVTIYWSLDRRLRDSGRTGALSELGPKEDGYSLFKAMFFLLFKKLRGFLYIPLASGLYALLQVSHSPCHPQGWPIRIFGVKTVVSGI